MKNGKGVVFGATGEGWEGKRGGGGGGAGGAGGGGGEAPAPLPDWGGGGGVFVFFHFCRVPTGEWCGMEGEGGLLRAG